MYGLKSKQCSPEDFNVDDIDENELNIVYQNFKKSH